MTIDGTQLLRFLEPPVRQSGANGATGAFRAPLDAQGFSSLLEQAGRGALQSGEPVAVPGTFGQALSAEDQQKLSRAADTAQAMGARRALVQLNGKSMMLDVQSRTIENEADGGGIRGQRVDAVINADESPGTSEEINGKNLLASLGSTGFAVRSKLIPT
ncbi:MAG TPA: hypothetical protein VG711_03645 [Phycisphaerales bacterium]|nr:hypothetical protein [Phycisphaerales bacterium]